MDKETKNEDKGSASGHYVSKTVVIIIAVLVFVFLAGYFAFVYFFKPGVLNTSFYNALQSGTENNPAEARNNTAKTAEAGQDLSSYFIVTKVDASLAVPGKEATQEEKLKINAETDEAGFSINSRIDAGSEIKFNITIGKVRDLKSGDLQCFIILPEGFEKIRLSEEKKGILFDPFSKKIIIRQDAFDSEEEINVSFDSIISKDYEDGQAFTITVEISAQGRQFPVAGITGSINAVADFKNSAMTVKDINGGRLWAEESIGYEVKIVNSGKGASGELTVKCPVPSSTGLVQGSIEPNDYTLSPDKSLITWNIGRLKPGQVVVLGYRVFTADYLTYKSSIKSDFTINEKNSGEVLFSADAPEISSAQYSYQTIFCMGDSQIVVTEWPLILDELLETQYPHAEFNTIQSGIRGEMATNAIARFDKDVRPYNPDIIILGYGSNDAGEEPAFFRYHMGILIQQALSTGAHVFVHGIGYIDLTNHLWAEKSNYPLFDKMLEEEICPKYGVTYIDIYKLFQEDPDKYMSKDGIHWSKEGADLVAHEVFKSIVKNLDPDGKLKQESISGNS